MLDEKTEIEDLMRLSLSVSETFGMNSGSLILLPLILFRTVKVHTLMSIILKLFILLLILFTYKNVQLIMFKTLK
jgi:hypothetical protein